MHRARAKGYFLLHICRVSLWISSKFQCSVIHKFIAQSRSKNFAIFSLQFHLIQKYFHPSVHCTYYGHNQCQKWHTGQDVSPRRRSMLMRHRLIAQFSLQIRHLFSFDERMRFRTVVADEALQKTGNRIRHCHLLVSARWYSRRRRSKWGWAYRKNRTPDANFGIYVWFRPKCMNRQWCPPVAR